MAEYSKTITFAGVLLTILLAQMVHDVQGYRALTVEAKEEKCQHIQGRSFTGEVLRKMTTVTHFKCCYQCHNKCDSTKTLCIGWTFVKETGTCVLYKDIFYMNIEQEVISGINDCFSST